MSPEQFWAKVEKTETCWLWTGLRKPTGYGIAKWKSGGRYYLASAHRMALALVGVEIPVGYQVDHLCKVTSCVNPAHLEPVTPHENWLRGTDSVSRINSLKTYCKHGHEFTPENTIWRSRRARSNPSRLCRECNRQQCREARARRAARDLRDAGIGEMA